MKNPFSNMKIVLADVEIERRRQEQKGAERRSLGESEWLTLADPRLDDSAKMDVVLEELGEVAKERNERRVLNVTPGALYEEIVETAACLVAWAESLADTERVESRFAR